MLRSDRFSNLLPMSCLLIVVCGSIRACAQQINVYADTVAGE
ncbi:MAG: hypothetical protein U0992_02165 [Planctomycetaceae bacterium]